MHVSDLMVERQISSDVYLVNLAITLDAADSRHLSMHIYYYICTYILHNLTSMHSFNSTGCLANQSDQICYLFNIAYIIF